MNKTKWSRVTVVLDKKTGDEIRYVSAVTGTPVSEIVRDVISSPVAQLAGTLRELQADPSPERLEQLRSACGETVDSAHAEFHRRHG
jgi:hypothetical protein